MYRLFVIAGNNMKKQRSDMITFLILTCLAALLLFDCGSALTGLGHVLDDKFKEVNGADIILYTGDSEAESLSAQKAFKNNRYITDYEITPIIIFSTEYKNEKTDEYSSFQFIAEDFDIKKRIMNIPVPDFGHNMNDILLPYNMKSNFAVGDILQVKLDDEVYSFKVAGYLEDPYYCSTMNITTYYVGMHNGMMDKLLSEHPGSVKKYNAYKGIADRSAFPKDYGTKELESEIAETYKNSIANHDSLESGTGFTDYFLVNWDMMKGGSEFIPMIVMAIILLFAVIILTVALIIISFSIRNFIQRNMKNTGILEAAGYTAGELRWALSIEITVVAIAGSLMGIAIALFSFGSFGNIISSVLGISWNQPASLKMALFTLLGVTLVVLLVSRLISRAYKKISVLDALRGGISAHNYKKNFFPFEKTALPVPFVLSLKDTFGGLAKNILMIFISMVLTIATLAGFGLKENYGDDPEAMLKMMGFEMGTAEVGNRKGGDISEDLKNMPGVKNVLTEIGFEPSAHFDDKKSMVYTYAVDDFKNTINTFMIEGRMPETANEILLTNGVAIDLGAKVGDVIEIEYAGRKENYLVCGINQRIERMGRTIYMLLDGVKKLLPQDLTPGYRYLITAEENVSFDSIKEEVKKVADQKGLMLTCDDINKVMESTVDTLNSSMNAICVVILILTALIVIFVESLVIRAKISREWRNLGISKALGQTSIGLMVQIMLTNIPAITVGALIGALLAESAGKFFTKTAFSLFAMKEAAFEISLSAIFIAIAGIITVAIITSFLTGLKVRKLIPVEMITEE